MSPATNLPFAPTDAFQVGPHNIFTRNGITLNDLSLLETYVVEEFVGFEKPDGQVSSEANVSTFGGTRTPSFWGERTMTLSGFIRAGTYTTAMNMGEALRISLFNREEMPMTISTAPGSVLEHEDFVIDCEPADFSIDPKAKPGDTKGKFIREFSVTLHASYPFYERRVMNRADANWTGQPYFTSRQSYDVSAGMGTTANGPGTIPTLNLPGYRVACAPIDTTVRIAGPVGTSTQDWMPVYEGEQIYGAVFAWVVTPSADLNLYTEVLWRDASGAIIGSAISAFTPATTTGGYTLSCTGTAPAGAVWASRSAYVRRTSTATTDVWFTNAWTGLGTLLPFGSYKDGNSPGWMWDGVEGESFSRPSTYTTFTLTPTVVSIPGRPYDRVYDLGYTELMDQNGNLVTTGPNVVDVLTYGTGDARLLLTMTGPMEGIVLVNETTKQAMYFTDVPSGASATVDTYTGEVWDQDGNARPSLIDPRSDYIYLQGRRPETNGGLNRFVLYVSDFDTGASFSGSFHKTHF